MLYLNSVRVAPGVRSALAVACGLALSVPGGARADDEGLGPVVVSASRMPQLLQTAPIGATIITSEQIHRSGVADANEAIRKLAGVAGKSDLTGGREYSLDLRGYGEIASQNLVVLIDGIRVNENELAAARLSAIPLDLIDHIEILRGGASVLWGEGASAGVVNVIFKKPQGGEVRTGRIGASVESFKGHEAFASGQWGLGQLALDASARHVRTDGFRDNGAFKQDVVAAGLHWTDGALRVGLRIQQEDQSAGLPGAITLEEYKANRRLADKPTDFADNRETRYLMDLSYARGPWKAQVDVGLRELDSTSRYAPSPASVSSRTQQQVAPRLVYTDGFGAFKFSGIVGVDWQGWYIQKGSGPSAFEAVHDNRAFYAQTDIRLPTDTRLTAGWRREWAHRLTSNYERDDKVHAGEVGVNQTVVKGLDVYGRLASSYRLANVDEYTYTMSSAPLVPQTNKDAEIGAKLSQGPVAVTARYFVQKTDNEVAFNKVTFFNANLDPTRRRGVELEGRWSLSKDFSVSGAWQQVTARFRAGPNAGKEMVLVSPHTGTVRVAYRFDDRNTIDVGAQYLSSMRPYADVANTCSSRVPSFTFFDARYAWSDRVWTVALSGTNLADRMGYSYDYSCDATQIYPYAGRSLKLAVSRQF